MRLNKPLFSLAVLITSWGLLGSNQACALGDEEAAALFGMAVGGLTAIALNHNRVARTEVYPPRHRHSEPRRTASQYIDHYVIIESHHEHNYRKNNRGHGHGKRRKKAVKYRNALNYRHDADSHYNSTHVRRYKYAY